MQQFGHDGTLRHEWTFTHPIQNVYSDGVGGIVYDQHGDSAPSSGLQWWPAGDEAPTEVLSRSVAFGDGGLASFLGITVVEGSPAVLYTTIEIPEDGDECVGCNPNYREVLHRRGLLNADPLRLDQVGGYEWGFEPTAITPGAVYGFNGSDGGQWNSAHALDPGSTAELPPLKGPDGAYSECFEEPDGEWCPTLIVPVDDDFVAGFRAASDVAGVGLIVLAYIDGISGEIADYFPVVLTDDGWNVLGVQVSGERLVLNTSNAYGHVGGRRVEHLRRPIIVDLASRTAEVYDRYGTFHLTPIWDRQQ